jgi:hypothetical protein
MEKLKDVVNIVAHVGESSSTHGLKEKDLPSGLHTILGTLRRCVVVRSFISSVVLFEISDLHGIEAMLQECRKPRGVKRILLRGDILGRIKQYDSKLLYCLQSFQVSSRSRIGFIQVRIANHPTGKIGFGFSACIDCSGPQGIELLCFKWLRGD